jgi:hypothetical protein
MASAPLDVVEFTSENFYSAFSNDQFSVDEIRQHRRVVYLHNYLVQLGAKTLVIERVYTDGDYLDDFAEYYAKCFRQYNSRCRRLHVFQKAFTNDEFLGAVLSGDSDGTAQGSYLGFVVARPLPLSVIGRTVLKTYDQQSGRRYYTCTKKYTANVFGIDLTVDSLAFQEQDSVLAACATVALWSCFQKSAQLFGTPILTPAAITQSASKSIHYGRPIPSHGLDAREMCNAIRSVGLEPELLDVSSTIPLVSLLYGYLSAGIPVILGVTVEGRGGHAITLAGYSLQNKRVHSQEVAATAKTIPMTGLRIDAFYGHDDQVGPFSRLNVMPSAIVGNNTYPVCFESSWTDEKSGKKLALYPRIVIAPIYHKVRLTFLDVQKWLTKLHRVAQLVFQPNAELEWDVRLAFSNGYKAHLRGMPGLESQVKEEMLLAPHPRFIWAASLRLKGVELVELLFDATGIANSLSVYWIVWRDERFATGLLKVFRTVALNDILTRTLGGPFCALIRDSLEKNHGTTQRRLSF